MDLFRFSLGVLSSIAVLVAGFIVFVLSGDRSPDFLMFLFENGVINIQGLSLGMLATLLLASAIEATNDVYDVETDKANQRFDRPIARGAFSPEYVRILCVVLYSISVLISIILVFVFDVTAFLILATLICVVIGVGYNFIKSYGFLGNMWVSIGYVAPLFIGFFLLKPQGEVLLLSCLLILAATFFLATGREIVKDIQDYEGDLMSNLNSLAVKFGPKKAAFVAMIFFAATVFCATFVGILVYNNLVFWFFIIALVIIMGITSITVITEPPSSGGKKARKYTRWALWWALAAFFFGVFFIN